MNTIVKIVNDAIDNGILNVIHADDNFICYEFYSCFEYESHLYKYCSRINYGGFVTDKENHVVRGVLNRVFTYDNKIDSSIPQLITKSDGFDINNFFGHNSNGLDMITPIEEIKTSTDWLKLIKTYKENGTINVGNYYGINRFNISEMSYIQNKIENIKIKEQLNNQLRCANIIKEGLQEVGKSIAFAGGEINDGLMYLRRGY